MKKFLAFLLLICIFVFSISCSNNVPDESLGVEGDSSGESNTLELEDTSGDTAETVEVKEVFRVGFSRQDITPDEPVYLDSTANLLDKVRDPICATCVAVHDGENTVLIYTIDTKNIGPDEAKQIREKISDATKVPSENIMIGPTHNHSVPKLGTLKKYAGNLKWTVKVHKAMINAAKEAISDLSDAEIYTATGKTTGMAFVRRYLLGDGTYTGILNGNKSKAPVVAYESEADDTVQIIRFIRADKKDVLMANWQAHVAHAIDAYPDSITSDLVGFARDTAESLDEDVLFALYIGASGNINLTAKVPGTRKYRDYASVGKALGKVIIEACGEMEKVNSGKISVSSKTCEVEYRKDDEETVRRAKEVRALRQGSPEYNALLDEYGFNSSYEISSIISRNNAKGTEKFYIAALSFGDLGFVSVPYEMFDTNGMQIKEGSPFKMTFVLTNADGWAAYVPSAEAIPHGGYEVYTTSYVFGTAERMVEELLGMLKEQVK